MKERKIKQKSLKILLLFLLLQLKRNRQFIESYGIYYLNK